MATEIVFSPGVGPRRQGPTATRPSRFVRAVEFSREPPPATIVNATGICGVGLPKRSTTTRLGPLTTSPLRATRVAGSNTPRAGTSGLIRTVNDDCCSATTAVKTALSGSVPTCQAPDVAIPDASVVVTGFCTDPAHCSARNSTVTPASGLPLNASLTLTEGAGSTNEPALASMLFGVRRSITIPVTFSVPGAEIVSRLQARGELRTAAKSSPPRLKNDFPVIVVYSELGWLPSARSLAGRPDVCPVLKVVPLHVIVVSDEQGIAPEDALGEPRPQPMVGIGVEAEGDLGVRPRKLAGILEAPWAVYRRPNVLSSYST